MQQVAAPWWNDKGRKWNKGRRGAVMGPAGVAEEVVARGGEKKKGM